MSSFALAGSGGFALVAVFQPDEQTTHSRRGWPHAAEGHVRHVEGTPHNPLQHPHASPTPHIHA